MEEETRRFVRRMIEPILTAFRREVAQQRANGAKESTSRRYLLASRSPIDL